MRFILGQESHHREGPGGRPAPIHLICVTHAGFQQSMKPAPHSGSGRVCQELA
jgi:hypothetical protein